MKTLVDRMLRSMAWADRQVLASIPRDLALQSEVLPLLRLRYGGSAHHWGFGLHLTSSDHYENQLLPTGFPTGTPEEALDCACGLYLDNPAT